MFTVTSFIFVLNRVREPGNHPLCTLYKQFKDNMHQSMLTEGWLPQNITLSGTDPTQSVLWFLLLLVSRYTHTKK